MGSAAWPLACGCLVFDPAVEFPDSRKPSFTSADEYQFNATMRRQRRH
jgi:hypothetical protein